MPGYPTIFPTTCCEDKCAYTWVGVLVLDCKADNSDVAKERCISTVCEIPQQYIDDYLEGVSKCSPCSGVGTLYVRLAFEGKPTDRPEGCYWLYLTKAPPLGGNCDDCPPPSCPSCCPDFINTPFWNAWAVSSWACSAYNEPPTAEDLANIEVIPWSEASGSLEYTYYQYAIQCDSYAVCETGTVPEGGTCSYCTLQDDDDDGGGGGGGEEPPGPTDKPCERVFGPTFKANFYASYHASWGQEKVSHSCNLIGLSGDVDQCRIDCNGDGFNDPFEGLTGCNNVRDCDTCERPAFYNTQDTDYVGTARSCINYSCAGRGSDATFTEPARWSGPKKIAACCNHNVIPDEDGVYGSVFAIAPSRSIAFNYDINITLPIYECDVEGGVYRALYREPDDAPWDECPVSEVERVDVVGYSEGVPYPQNTQVAPTFEDLPCNDGYKNGDLECSGFFDDGQPLDYLFASSRCNVNYPMLPDKRSWKGRWMAEVLFDPVTGITEMELIFAIDENASWETRTWCQTSSNDVCCREQNYLGLYRNSFAGPIFGPVFGRIRFASTERDPDTNLWVRPRQLNHFFNPWANPEHPYKRDLQKLATTGHCPPATSLAWRAEEYLPCIERPQTQGCTGIIQEPYCDPAQNNGFNLFSGPASGWFNYSGLTCESMYGDYSPVGGDDDWCPLWGGLFGPQQMNDPLCDQGGQGCFNGFWMYYAPPRQNSVLPTYNTIAVEDFVVNETSVIPCPRNEWARSINFAPGTGSQTDPNDSARVCNSYGVQEGLIYRLTYSAPAPGQGHASSFAATPP